MPKMTKAYAIERLNSILRVENADLHKVGCSVSRFRKVFLARQVPYRSESETAEIEKDKDRIWYKVYVIMDGELTDITSLVAVATGNGTMAAGISYGIAEPKGTAKISNDLRQAIEQPGESLPSWGL